MEYSLEFNINNYTVKTSTLNNITITYRAYENIVYVQSPKDLNYHIMNIFVPEGYYEGNSIGGYTLNTAPIFLPITVGGYMPGVPESPGLNNRINSPNAAFVALSKGYVVAAPGARGRTCQGENGLFTGKAPACIVDLKAAIRYLRYNKEVIPGDTNRIISNGTSAGGALSSLLGATGNSADYEPYLKMIGAAEERDDVFAASCYCPITNLENADAAYEWLFNGVNEYHKMVFEMIDGQVKPSIVDGFMTEEQIKVSEGLKAQFPGYLNSQGLKKADGSELALDENGEGSFKEFVKSFVIASAQRALQEGKDLSELTFLIIKDEIVKDLDFGKYAEYATRMKPAPAFDGLDLSTPENELFGTEAVRAKHFTQFSKTHSKLEGDLADADIVKLMNPMNYLGIKQTTAAQHWRIRHGAVDRDTSLAIPVILAAKLQSFGLEVDFAMPWGQGHGGDYDLEELFSWIEKLCLPQ